MPREIQWTDSEEIGIQLQEKYPGVDPLTYRTLRAIDRHVPRAGKWRDLLRDELVARF